MTALPWLILGMPLAGAALIFFFLLQKPKLAGWTATGSLALSFILTCLILSRQGITAPPFESSVQWLVLPSFFIEFGVLINGLSLLMLLIVTGVGTLIFLYSQEYMAHDTGYARYFASLSFFAFSMLGIVLANNLVQVFIFWELVGLSSYLLIGHWFEKPAAGDAAKKAFLTTRAGDVGFMLGILVLFGWMLHGGQVTFNFLMLEEILHGIEEAGMTLPVLTAASLLIFLGIAGKSAQFPLHVWLPDAMEGPTPVSALIHAATMVAAGVFLLTRFFFLFSASPAAMNVILAAGTVTAVLAAFLALVQTDIKRILAYSTLSQLGYMVACLGLGNPRAGMFHLTTHAFFKALLFLGAGSVIHAVHDQDIRKMSGLLKKLPVTGWTFLAGTLALAGIFPFSGFWSKEEILATAASSSPLVFCFLLGGALLTAIYMGRLFAVVFLGPSSPKEVHEPGWRMKLPLMILAVFAVLSGFFPIKEFVSAGQGAPQGPEGIGVTVLGLSAGVAGFLGGLFFYLKRAFHPAPAFLEKKYYMDEFYDALIRNVQDRFAAFCDIFERYIIVSVGVNGVARITGWVGAQVRKIQTGQVQFYALIFSLGATLLAYGFILWAR